MKQPPLPSGDNEILYRYEITAAMNQVVRACQEVVRRHSTGNNWRPEGAAGPMATTHHQLVDQARRDVLDQLHIAVSAAEEVAYGIESDRRRRSGRRVE